MTGCRSLETTSLSAGDSDLPPDRLLLGTLSERFPVATTLLSILLLNGIVVLYLWLIGRPMVPESVPLQLFSSDLSAGENSLHLSDPYSLLHVVFGIGLFLFIDWMRPGWPFRSKLIVAIGGSTIWELVENTPVVVALFQEPDAAGVYRGDSIANALSDTVFVAIGFVFARSVSLPIALAAIVLIEIIISLWIGDGFVIGSLKLLGIL